VFVGLFAVSIAATRPRVFLRLFLVGAVAAAIGAIIASPWYVAMESAHPGYLRYYFVERHVEGYLTATQRHAGRGWWYYLGIVAGGALPWLPFAFGAAREVRRAAPRMVVALWFVSGLVFLSIGESKLATYALPVFPALAILIGDYLARSVLARERPPAFAAGLMACGAAAAMLPVVGALALRMRFDVTAPWLLVVAAASAMAIGLACLRAWSAREDRSLAWLGGAVFASVAIVIVVVLPRAADRMTARDLASLLNRRGTLPSRVLVLDERIGSVIFYLSPALRAQATPERFTGTTLPGAFERLRAEAPDAVLAVRGDQVDRVRRLLPGVRADAAEGLYSIFSFQTLRAAAAGVSAGGSGRTE
jgi:4-amino-4-deoxy-L-arabinose transferase-like glycosyltransferase